VASFNFDFLFGGFLGGGFFASPITELSDIPSFCAVRNDAFLLSWDGRWLCGRNVSDFELLQ
jgi:hypothetical protein